jgi:hypothetical protein
MGMLRIYSGVAWMGLKKEANGNMYWIEKVNMRKRDKNVIARWRWISTEA